jgi:hypothetical protein
MFTRGCALIGFFLAVALAARATPVPSPLQCGNGIIESGEDCDDGGTCIGSANAGTTHCTDVAQCPGGQCKTFGGGGCAANCTFESDVVFSLIAGQLRGAEVVPGTSAATVHSDVLVIPLPLAGRQTLTIGKQRDGMIPLVVKADSVHFPAVAISTLGIACVRVWPDT